MKYTKRGKMIRIFGIIILAAATLIIIFPFYWMVKTSFQSNSSMFQVPPSFFPEVIDISSFYEVLMKKPIVIWMKNSLLVTVSVTLISMVLSTLTAYSLSRYRNKANTIFSFLILTTQMLPSTLFVLPIYREFNRFSLMDTHSGIVIAYTTFALPICIWMLKGYFDSIPTDLEEAATIEGCSRLGTIWRIIMPLAKPGYMATAIFAFINAWGEYLFAKMLLSSQSNWLLSNGLASFKGEYTTPWNWIMAAAIIYALPPLILFLFMQKYLVSGMTAGAVKS